MYYPFFGAIAPFIQQVRCGPSFLELALLTRHSHHHCCDYGFNFHHRHHGYGYRYDYGRYY